MPWEDDANASMASVRPARNEDGIALTLDANHYVISPDVGELGLAAYSLRGMRPAKNASRPASIARRIARAIRTGSRASAIAVFINTPAQPSSIAIAASEAVPTPASTNTGTR